MPACPHCNASVNLREVKHEGWFATRRTCPFCNLSFDLDAKTKARQSVFLAALGLSLALTVLFYVNGRLWAPWAIASYVLAGGLLYYGNKNVHLIACASGETRPTWLHRRKCRKLSERAFELNRPILRTKDAEHIRAFIYDYQEWGLGVEALVDLLLEERIAVTTEQKQAIVDAMEAMGLKRHQLEIETKQT